MTTLDLHAHFNRPTYPTPGQPQLVYALLEARLPRRGPSAPVNLGLVIDVSASMRIPLLSPQQFEELAGQGLVHEVIADGIPVWQFENVTTASLERYPRPIDYVAEALKVVLEQARPTDRLSVVAFAARAETVLPLTPGKEKRRLKPVIQSVGTLNLGDDTMMGAGMALSFQELQRGAAPEYATRMLLLTDGFTRDHASCLAWTAQAAAAGYAISTLGLGTEFNEELLIPMAEQTGGRAHFVADPGRLPDVFRAELAAAQAVGFRRAELKLHLTPGVELRRVTRVKPALARVNPGPNTGGSYAIPLGDMEWDAPPAFLLELIVPARAAGEYRLAQAVLSSDPVGAGRATARTDLVGRFMAGAAADVDADAPADARVMGYVERVVAFNLQTRALEEAAAGDVESATRRLHAAATRLLDMGETKLGRALQQQAEALEGRAKFDATATKELQYATRQLTRKLP
ncbi:MAG: VWA domain-containing protein [Candidatus Promineofilum sp.]|nr:VWA domain-containing protein [Promineifilum sp.]